MRKLIIGALALAALFVYSRPAAAAGEAPWCAVVRLGAEEIYWDCRFASLEACRPYVIAGTRGFCNPNPAWQGPSGPVKPAYKRAKRWDRHG